MNHEKIWFYIGTYTHAKGKGIYRCDFDLNTGKLSFGQCENQGTSDKDPSLQGLAVEATQPSFLAVHPTRPFVYCVNEIRDYLDRESGAVSAYEIEPITGRLKFLNRLASLGPAPCYLSIDTTGRCLMAANYTGGSVVCFPILSDGRLGTESSFIQHDGSSIHPTRQLSPHAHCITPDPAGRFAFAADLGQDKVLVYRMDASNGNLTPHSPSFVDLPPGAGPRHIVFAQNSRFAYVINELASTLSTFQYDAKRGILNKLMDTSTLPNHFNGESDAAGIAVHPSGRFLYCSNRGHDSIAIFAINHQNGIPMVCGHQSTLGHGPRHFCITPDGKYLLVANQLSENISVFRVDSESGNLCPLTSSFKLPNPVCLLPTRVLDYMNF